MSRSRTSCRSSFSTSRATTADLRPRHTRADICIPVFKPLLCGRHPALEVAARVRAPSPPAWQLRLQLRSRGRKGPAHTRAGETPFGPAAGWPPAVPRGARAHPGSGHRGALDFASLPTAVPGATTVLPGALDPVQGWSGRRESNVRVLLGENPVGSCRRTGQEGVARATLTSPRTSRRGREQDHRGRPCASDVPRAHKAHACVRGVGRRMQPPEGPSSPRQMATTAMSSSVPAKSSAFLV